MMNETEKAIRALELLKERKVVPVSEEKMNEFLEMAIKALEQEPILDKISSEIIQMPTEVFQEPKTGHWIEVIDEIDCLGNKTWHHECSICGNEDSGWGDYKYCPNCGAKMVEPQESEE